MVLAALRAPLVSSTCNPLPPPSTWYSPCWLNGRRYLKPSTTPYFPICLSFAPIIFSNINELVLDSKASKRDTKDMLVKACMMATEEYVKIRERKSVLPECVMLMEDIGAGMWR